MAASYFAFVGSRTSKERNARGNGINVYSVDTASGRWTHRQLVGDLVNPSYLAFDRTGRQLYAVHGDLSEVSAFTIAPGTGTLALLNRVSTEGKNPVHVSVDPTNRFLLVANHITSTVAVIPRREDGSLGTVSDLVTLSGLPIGPHRVEQPFAKPHQVEFDPAGRFVLVPDKGLDATFVFQLNADSGKLSTVAGSPVRSREGAGPRHISCDSRARFAYVVNELDSTITAYAYDSASGTLRPIQVVSSLPDDFVANSRGAEIAVSRNGFVYVSNRGHDSIGVFAADAETGRLRSRSWHSAGGRTPRFFALSPDERFLFAANEDSDTIVGFAIDGRTGALTPTGDSVQTGSPVCIVFRTV